MRKAGLGLQSDFDRQVREIARLQSPPPGLRPDPQHVLFVDIEIDPDRVELHDGGELRRRRRADKFADRDEMRADDAVEWRGDMGIAVIDRRDLGVDLGLQQVRLRVVARRGGSIQRGLGKTACRWTILLLGACSPPRPACSVACAPVSAACACSSFSL